MKKTALTLSVFSLILASGVSVAHAQYTGPSASDYSTVAQVLDNAKDDSYVQLKGKIIKKVGKEKYTFADDSGEIRVEIDNDVFKSPVDGNTMVEIRGEYEKDFLESPEIDVDAVIVHSK